VGDVVKGKVVEIAYILRLEDGTVADETGDQPLAYLHGSDEIIDGLHAALEGHDVGEKLKVIVAPADAFGEYDESLIDEVPTSDLPDDAELEVGQEIVAETDDGELVPAFVGAIEKDTVFLDFNHPLAGETLHYELEIVGVREPTAVELERGSVSDPDEEHEHGCECCEH